MSISRRKFLGLIGSVGATTGLCQSANAATNKDFSGYPESFAVLHDISLCVGCRSCEAACNEVNNLEVPDTPFTDTTVLDQKRRTTSKNYTVVNRYASEQKPAHTPVFRKNQCNHCLEPACASACFVRAFRKTEQGAVVYDPSVCVGCRYCMVACPFDIPTYEYDNAFSPKIMKCTMCYPRILEGKRPGCVESCPTEALVFGKRTDLISIARNRIAKFPDKYINHIYGEHEMGGTSWLYLSNTPFKDLDMREDLGTTAAPKLTAGALGAVPMVVAVWPILLTGIYAINKRKDKISKIETQQAVQRAIDETNASAEVKMTDLKAQFEKQKTRAIEKEVKKAISELQQKQDKENA